MTREALLRHTIQPRTIGLKRDCAQDPVTPLIKTRLNVRNVRDLIVKCGNCRSIFLTRNQLGTTEVVGYRKQFVSRSILTTHGQGRPPISSDIREVDIPRDRINRLAGHGSRLDVDLAIQAVVDGQTRESLNQHRSLITHPRRRLHRDSCCSQTGRRSRNSGSSSCSSGDSSSTELPRIKKITRLRQKHHRTQIIAAACWLPLAHIVQGCD